MKLIVLRFRIENDILCGPLSGRYGEFVTILTLNKTTENGGK